MNIGEYNKKRNNPEAYYSAKMAEMMATFNAKLAEQGNTKMERYFDTVLQETFQKKFDEFKKEIEPVFEEWMTQTFEQIITDHIKGEKGEKGDKGDRGEKGEEGDTIIGPKGADGRDGRDGKDGKNGLDGKDGEDGKDGKDGKSIDKEEILKEVRPEFQKMRNEITRGLKQKGGGGGGGIGLPTQFSFTGDGVTTSFQLSANVMAGGRAIWAYYQGQWIQPTTHYTVSGKTFSTTFTPANGQIIEGFFFRA